MYPNLYHVFKEWFGIEWQWMSILNTFGLMVAISFLLAAVVLNAELKRREKLGLLFPREEWITVGKPATFIDLLINFITGFLFGYKLLGVVLSRPDNISAQDYLFSAEGNILAGLVLGGVLAYIKWKEKDKQKLKEPEQRAIRIWPHDRVGDMVIISLIFGIIGAKLFDNIEHWDDFVKDPIGMFFSRGGLTFYGGLICAAIAIAWYSYKKGIKIKYLMDAIAPALMIAYAVGRIGCQVSGDGDWGIYNSAYVTDTSTAKLVSATPEQFKKVVENNAWYFLDSKIKDGNHHDGRKAADFEHVQHSAYKAPAFLPVWMVAYNYPNNVNSDGIRMPGCTEEEYCSVLPAAVFPTSLYETIICTLLFLLLLALRNKIKTPGVIFGIYLILNGLERFVIEKIRVNDVYTTFGMNLSQAQEIAIGLILFGIGLIIGRVYLERKSLA